ncbi:Sodium/calcium exchanger protein [Rhizoctonia solani]|uniref:Sodium/calcium exchanger protein n=1 Tax=Rhizoctonia solani TaxID=456999 RepID=A0A8H7H6K5_9AGAM|nr:Sodium/calcium exchanger protein [Rhizoctonia solani]
MTSPPASTILDEKDRASVPEQIRPDSSLERDKAALLAPPSLSPKTTRTSGDGLRIHGNASTPANIGGNTDIERADSVHSLGAGGIGPDRVRRRRNRRAPDSSWNPRAPPAPRRANSLPVDPVTIVPATPKIDFGHALSKMLVPQQKLAPAPTWTLSAVNIMKYSYLNILLVFVPVSWACHFTGQQPTIIFIFSFLAIIPLAALLGFATEELALRVGQTLGGLLNATFGNAVELIIAILALVRGELRVVQASMLGSILSNCLLVLGMCFFAGGIRFHEQGYGVRAAQLNISLLCISVFSIVIPAAFHASLNSATTANGQTPGEAAGESAAIEEAHVLAISRGTSIILLFVYACYLFFQLWTHAYIYTPEASAHHAAQTFQPGFDGPGAPTSQRVFHMPSLPSLPSIFHGSGTSSTSSISSVSTEEDETVPKLKIQATMILLATVTVLTGVTAEWLVDSIDGLTKNGNISREFVALILLPLVGNAAEHVTAVTVSVKNKLDLAITVAVGSSIQIALFVLPFLILLGWMIGQPLTLFFDIFETVVVFVSVLIINYAISDGKTNWLEGLVLMVVYVIIGLSVWYYPGAVSNER